MIGNIVVILLTGAALGFAVRKLWKKHKNGQSIFCDCTDCEGCSGCNRNQN